MRGVSVEGEIGVLGSLETGSGEKEDGHGIEGTVEKALLLTDPELAVKFVEMTDVDALAEAVGTSHGAYKFSRWPTGDILATGVIEADTRPAAKHPSVMHEASTIQEDLVAPLPTALPGEVFAPPDCPGDVGVGPGIDRNQIFIQSE
jgi:fructose-bisphosphate aldolase class II